MSKTDAQKTDTATRHGPAATVNTIPTTAGPPMMPTPAPNPYYPAKEKVSAPATLVRDPEVVAMDRLARILNALDAGTRMRVLAWLNAKYGEGREALTGSPELD